MNYIVSMIILCATLLVSCAPLDKNKLKETESVSAQKNNSYRVYGKRYHVLKSSKNYEEKGIASWYGKRFNKKRTSSGERYNMHNMTAAHKTLPFATKVLVTNVKTGKQIVVRINDRGPFVKNRLIDLSYAAAKKLGIIGKGLAKVHVKAIEKQV